MSYKKSLVEKIKSNNSKIAIIGLGYVGLPLCLDFAEQGFSIVGIDVDLSKVELLRKGKSYIKHISEKEVNFFINNSLLKPTSDFSEINSVDVIIICVPTPLNIHREPDLSYVRLTIKNILPYIKKGQIISLESTTYPGTTEEEFVPIIEKKGFKIGEEIFLVYSPEREDPGNAKFDTSNIPKVVGGITEDCGDVGEALYKNPKRDIVKVSSTRAAEMTKLLENIHRSVNIGLVNELKPLTECMNIDIYEVINAASSKPFGFSPYYPGPGLGGHCIPIDPFYLTWKAREYGMNTKFIELAGEINKSMPNYVIQKISESLNQNCKSVKLSKILVLGIAYKKNVDDMRESPSLEIIQLLLSKGANVDYCDPFFEEIPPSRKHKFKLKGIELNQTNLMKYDLILLATDHDCFDYELIKKSSALIVDTRGRFKPSAKIFRA